MQLQTAMLFQVLDNHFAGNAGAIRRAIRAGESAALDSAACAIVSRTGSRIHAQRIAREWARDVKRVTLDHNNATFPAQNVQD